MTANAYVDACGFNPVSNGTGDFVVNAAITGYQTPASAGAVNASVYSYRAESNDKSQWEIGFGAYTVSSTTLARTTVSASSTGSKVSFTSAPNVYITALTADLQNASLLTSGAMLNPTFSGEVVLSGLATDGSSSGTGFLMTNGHNSVNNKQFWLGDVDYVGNASARFLRVMSLSGLTYLSAIKGDGSANQPVVIDSSSYLDFGGVTSGNAGLTASGTQVQAILGDNSGFGDFKCRNLTVSGTSSFAKPADQQIFNGSGTWTKPSGFGAKAMAFIQAWGAGGGGIKKTTSADGAGGGGYKERWILLSSLGATETVTIGTGGTASTTAVGAIGGNTTFGSWATGYGGGSTVSGAPSPAGGPYGTGLGTGIGGSNDAYYWEGGIGSNANGPAGRAIKGGGGGGGAGSGETLTGGTSIEGGNGGTGSAAGAATAGTQPGGGGGSTNTGTAGSGANGKCVVTVFDGA